MVSLSERDRAILNCVFNPSLPLEEAYDEDIPELKDEEENTPAVIKTKQLELQAIEKTEKKNFIDAIKILTEAIDIAPNRASLFNNRAQVYRLQGCNLEALRDASKAIELSQGKGKSGCQALCQRGLLHRKAGRIELAKEDFAAAASLGSSFAKAQLVEINPYAALCNQMLKHAFENLK